jgi:hypothetical protein
MCGMNRALYILGWMITLATAAAAGLMWMLPVESFQTWAVERAGADEYARFEALGQATALTQLGRFALPVLALVLAACLWSWPRFSSACMRGTRQFLTATRCTSDRARLGPLRTLGLRMLILAWLLVAARHVVSAVNDRTREWIYFGLRSGDEVLPNISFQNRDVIRYLSQATPPGSKILVLSDQKLFFLAYYLLPRQVYHPMHPDAEFVIPQANQQRPLAAYELGDISPEYLERLRPDYILEYFEGAAYVDRERIAEDPRWIEFWRESHRSAGLPEYMVILRPYAGEQP